MKIRLQQEKPPIADPENNPTDPSEDQMQAKQLAHKGGDQKKSQ